MVRDILNKALGMLGLAAEADDNVYSELLRCYNLVISELFDSSGCHSYESLPSAYALTDSVPSFRGVSDRVIAYGIAAEYCITKGLDEAELWDKRFKSELARAHRRFIRIKARRFL